MKSKPAKTERRIKTSIYLSAEQLRLLKEISAKTDVPIARLLRRAVDRVISEHK